MLAVLFFTIWLLLIMILDKFDMHFFKFIIGSVGLFWLLMFIGRASVESYLEYMVTYSMWLIGKLSGLFTAYPDYSMITVYYKVQAVSFFVDYECSGFIEILVYICLLLFYPVYVFREKLKYAVFGTVFIFAANVIRVLAICLLVKAFGPVMFFFSHTVFARLLFFGLMVILYYYVFTRPHILRQKVGNLSYAKQ